MNILLTLHLVEVQLKDKPPQLRGKHLELDVEFRIEQSLGEADALFLENQMREVSLVFAQH